VGWIAREVGVVDAEQEREIAEEGGLGRASAGTVPLESRVTAWMLPYRRTSSPEGERTEISFDPARAT
jgi:hypothetical protein